MNRPTLAALLTLAALTAGRLHADDLFTQNGLAAPSKPTPKPANPLANPNGSQSPTPGQPAPQGQPAEEPKPLTVAEIPKLLEAAELKPKKLNEKIYSVTITVEKRTIPVLFSLSENGEILWMQAVMPRADKPIPASVLAGLLEANGKYGITTFSLVNKNLIVLNHPLDSITAGPEDVTTGLAIIKLIAAQTKGLWDASLWQTAGAKPVETRPVVQSQPTPTPVVETPQPRHVGVWTAQTTAGRSYTLRLNADGKFQLESRGANNSVSAGEYSIEGDVLLLESKGRTTRVQLTWLNPTSFQFGSSKLVFRKA